ncbi:MAG: superoxide dismutase family protein [Burkholderiales bacterium]|nr:superoxide dismutase family protein [Burkholderiales bacterium]
MKTKFPFALSTLAISGALAAVAITAAHAADATKRANAELRTASGQPAGIVTFTQTGKGVRIAIDVAGLKPGEHGMHIHQRGECAPGVDPVTNQVVAFGAAGGHFDPGRAHRHGNPTEPVERVHGGDLPNLVVEPDGRAKGNYSASKLSVTDSATSIIGRAFIIHADADDYESNPAGKSGPRVLCGVIKPMAG